MGAFNEAAVYCTNPDCEHQGEHRIVSYPIVGNGLYAVVPVFCECGSRNECRLAGE